MFPQIEAVWGKELIAKLKPLEGYNLISYRLPLLHGLNYATL